jgi:hypothetical protein
MIRLVGPTILTQRDDSIIPYFLWDRDGERMAYIGKKYFARNKRKTSESSRL